MFKIITPMVKYNNDGECQVMATLWRVSDGMDDGGRC